MCRALEHAALRGVDIRILIPSTSDNYVVWLAGHAYLERMLEAGIHMYRYTQGFLHQKVFLVDDEWSCVGTANLDNRSFRLNFELSILVFSQEFSFKVEQMLLRDFHDSDEITLEEVNNYSFVFEVAANTARLFSPIL
jgi:cardiolipin synthase